MAKLNQIIGAILTEITKAQATSDVYSRDLKSSYREDPLLKLGSVPRAEIRDVTIDLKFVFATNAEKVKKITLYEHPNYQGNSEEFDFGNYDTERFNENPSSEEEAIMSEVDSGMRYSGDLGILIQALEKQNPLGSIKVPSGMRVTLYTSKGFQGEEKVIIDDVSDLLFSHDKLTSSIKVDTCPITEINTEVEVSTGYLEKLPETVISSISIKLDMSSI